MKQVCVAVIVLLSVTGCQKSTEDTKSTSAATTTSSSGNLEVSVNFTGLVTHVLGPIQKAVVVKAPDHLHRIKIVGASQAAGEVVQQINGECHPDSCIFILNFMSLQLLNVNRQPLTDDLKADRSFLTLVPDLGDMNASAYSVANLTREAKGEILAGSAISWGTFDLHGGNASSEPMACRGKITGLGDFRQFPKVTTVKYTLSGPGILRVTDAQGHKYDIPLEGPAVSIDVNNNNPASHHSDFDHFAKLSMVPANLPQFVNETSEACKKAIGEQNGVPGCHDSRLAMGTLK
jgi:hypothetical protein